MCEQAGFVVTTAKERPAIIALVQATPTYNLSKQPQLPTQVSEHICAKTQAQYFIKRRRSTGPSQTNRRS